MALLVGTVHGGMGRGDACDVPLGQRAAVLSSQGPEKLGFHP